jgi:hypothetical protein
MTTTQWVISVAVALIGGGAMGAVITSFVTRYRNKRQPIAYKLETIEVFKKNPDLPSLQAVLMEGDNPKFTAENLSIARITLINKGNQDMEKFNFGVTLKGTSKAIDIKRETPDRHHEMKCLTGVGLKTPASEIDFILEPFNRGEEYKLNIHFIYVDTPGSILVSSPHSTLFIDTNKEPSWERIVKRVGLMTLALMISYFVIMGIVIIIHELGELIN